LGRAAISCLRDGSIQMCEHLSLFSQAASCFPALATDTPFESHTCLCVSLISILRSFAVHTCLTALLVLSVFRIGVGVSEESCCNPLAHINLHAQAQRVSAMFRLDFE